MEDKSINRTSLSWGYAFREALEADEAVMAIATKVVWLKARDASLPYIYMIQEGGEEEQTKQGAADTITVSIYCLAEDINDMVDLCERVRTCLDSAQWKSDCGLTVRSCFYRGAQEVPDEDAYVKKLIFNAKL